MNKLYLISQSVNNGYDTYDSAVVCAATALQAKRTNPGGYHVFRKDGWYFIYKDGHWNNTPDDDNTWADVDKVTVKLLGDAKPSIEPGVVCASFHAG